MIVAVTDLEVYRQSLELVAELYQLLGRIDKSESDTISQIKRSAKSIPANIAEGFGKRASPREFKRFLLIALGSSDETVTHLRLLCITAPYVRNELNVLTDKFVVLSKRINKLHTSWISE